MPTVFPKNGRFFVALAAMDPTGPALLALQQKHPAVFQKGEQGFETEQAAKEYRQELIVLFEANRAPRKQ